MKIKYFAVLLLLSVGVLAGCGGSGGSSTASGPAPLATVTITSTNAPTITSAAFNSASLKLNSLSPLGVQTSTSSTDDHILNKVNDFALKRIAEFQNISASVTGVTNSYNCNGVDTTGGTYSYTSDGTGPSNSTYVTLTFSNCVLGSSTVNGTFSVTSYTITTNTQSAAVSINITITTTGSSTIKYVGGYSLSATGVNTSARTDTLTGSSLVFSVGSMNESLTNFSFSSIYNDITPATYTDTVNYTISSDFTGGSFTFTTTSPIVFNAGQYYPISGQAVIYGANSSALRATVVSSNPSAGTSSGTVTVDTSANNGSTWTFLFTKMWSQL